jgi:hypothetical protein
MTDVIYVGVFIVMVVLGLGYIRVCNRIVGDVDAIADPVRDDR